jgi:hypothetical protein
MDTSSRGSATKRTDVVVERAIKAIADKLRANPGALDNCREVQVILRFNGPKIDVALKTTH